MTLHRLSMAMCILVHIVALHNKLSNGIFMPWHFFPIGKSALKSHTLTEWRLNFIMTCAVSLNIKLFQKIK